MPNRDTSIGMSSSPPMVDPISPAIPLLAIGNWVPCTVITAVNSCSKYTPDSIDPQNQWLTSHGIYSGCSNRPDVLYAIKVSHAMVGSPIKMYSNCVDSSVESINTGMQQSEN